MTDVTDRLDAIQKRADKATPGHWEASTGMADAAIVFMPDGYSFKINGHPDARFIAAAREDVPFLLDLARKQQAALDRAHALADEMDQVHGAIRGHVTTYQLRQALGGDDA